MCNVCRLLIFCKMHQGMYVYGIKCLEHVLMVMSDYDCTIVQCIIRELTEP